MNRFMLALIISVVLCLAFPPITARAQDAKAATPLAVPPPSAKGVAAEKSPSTVDADPIDQLRLQVQGLLIRVDILASENAQLKAQIANQSAQNNQAAGLDMIRDIFTKSGKSPDNWDFKPDATGKWQFLKKEKKP